jgi:hypothetical protein
MIDHLLSNVTMLLSQVSSAGGIFRKSRYFVITVTLQNISDRGELFSALTLFFDCCDMNGDTVQR